MAVVATLNGSNLPDQFRYKPFIQRKRQSTNPTANAVVIQYSNPQIVHGDGSLVWSCESCYPTEFQSFWNLYSTTTPALYVFTGYWGETYEVYFNVFDAPSVRGRLFDLSGQFQVISVTADYTATCSP